MSRRELTKRAAELAEELGQEVNADRMSNAQLETAIEELEQQKAAAAELEALPEGPARIEEDAPSLLRGELLTTAARISTGGPPRFAYQVAPGHTIKCRRGNLKRGHEVRAEWIGGEARLAELVASGAVLRGPLASGAHLQD